MLLGEKARLRTGQTFKKAPEHTEQGDLSVLLPRDLSDGKIISSPTKINSGVVAALNNHLLKKEDILIVNKGSKFGSFIYDNNPAFAIATSSFFVITPGPQLSATFLHWYLNQSPAKHYLWQHASSSTTIPTLTKSVLENLPIPDISIEEQHRLAAIFTEFQREKSLLKELMATRAQLCDTYIWDCIKNNL